MSFTNPVPILPGPIAPVERDTDLEASRNAAAADFDSFLTLLTAQLENQDPLEPIESTEFVAQLASFSSVEQLIGVNDQIEALAAQSLGGDIASLSSWIGNDVAVASGEFRGTGGDVQFPVPQGTVGTRTEAIVIDEFGTELRRFDVTSNGGAIGTWDGTDALGVPVIGRDLKIELAVIEGGTETSRVAAEVLRRVAGLRGTDSGLVIDLTDGGQIAPEQISRVVTPTPPAS